MKNGRRIAGSFHPTGRTPVGRMIRVVSLLAGLLGLSPRPLLPQVPRTMSIGTRVRVSAPGLGLHQASGVVQRSEEGNLLVRFDGKWNPMPLESDAISSLEVSMRQRGNAPAGLLMGLAVGGALGWYVGTDRGMDKGLGKKCMNESGGAWIMVGPCVGVAGVGGVFKILGYAALGGTVGALIGNSIKTDVWAPAELEGKSLSIVPTIQPRGGGLSATLSF